jgi:hypothetical protein
MKLLSGARAGYLAMLATGAATAFAVVGNAAAAPAAHVATTVTHHYSLAASAFAPDEIGNPADDYFNQWNPTTLSNQDSGRCFNAGLSLPPDVTMKSVTAYYTAGSDSMNFEINRQFLPDHTASVVVEYHTQTSATPTYMSTTKPIQSGYGTVNYSQFAYSAGVCPLGNTTFSGLTITYTQPAG